jgi:hypothetical protein
MTAGVEVERFAVPRESRRMDALTLYGVCAVVSMLVFYSLENRHPLFVLAFAVACLASSAYGFLQGAWPFGVVEAVWTLVAVRRWHTVSTGRSPAK